MDTIAVAARALLLLRTLIRVITWPARELWAWSEAFMDCLDGEPL